MDWWVLQGYLGLRESQEDEVPLDNLGRGACQVSPM